MLSISIPVLILVFSFAPSNVFAFSILQNGNWNIHANGYNGILKIDSVDNQGNVKGIMTNTTTSSSSSSSDKDDETRVYGFYDPLLQKIQIYNIVDSNPVRVQHYTGFLFKEGSFGAASIADTMTGYFLGNGVNEGGWIAIKQIG
jgi:hypothetical protein